MHWIRREHEITGMGPWCASLTWLVVALVGLILCLPPVVSAQTAIGEPQSLTRAAPDTQIDGIAAETARDRVSLTRTQRRLVLRLVNQARAAGRNCGGGYGYFGPTHRVIWDGRLAQAAQRHSRDMASHNFFSHTGSDGTQVDDRIDDTGYDWRTCGENIAAGYGTIRAVVNAWLASPGHCANIMDPDFQEMGLGKASNAGSDYGTYWTQVFATTF
jgi:uncharacterized protein YkwD